MMTRRRVLIPAVLLAFHCSLLAHAQTMPDPKAIAGIPLPVSDVATGTVTVRVIRGSLANNIAGQPVELHGDGAARQQTTGESGRVEFRDLRPGARVRAVAVVAGERLESQEFAVPASGGIRVLLVATDPEAARRADEDRRLAAGPARQGAVVLGDQSRFVIELGDGALNVFSILQIVNTARTPVDTGAPVVFEAAPNGGNVTLLNGSSPRASAEGRRLSVTGPFPPGATVVQFAYAVPYSGPDATIEQRLPIPLNQLTVMAQKAGEMRLSSPQIRQQREMSAQGDTYIVAQGVGVAQGGSVSFSFSGLPHAAAWPRNVALTLAGLILAAGAWFAARAGGANGRVASRDDLETERDRLFSELLTLERQRQARAPGGPQAAVADRRRELVAELVSVYAALDR